MALADLSDINQHLPASTLQITDAEDDQWQIDAERIVRGYLSGVFSAATLGGWTTPGSTPGLIRSIAGRLIAAKFYASKVAGEGTDWPDYSDTLYKEAISYLEGIQTGDIVLSDVTEIVVVGDHITSDDFYPNDITSPAPMFSISQEFG